MTPAEQLLWARLRNQQLADLKFRRQHPIGRFIVDFYCHAQRLIVEIDGPVHFLQKDQDLARTQYLQARGYRVLRFQNQEVLQDMRCVLQSIQAVCQRATPDSTGITPDQGDDT